MLTKRIFFFASLFLAFTGYSQDMHYSNYDYNLMYINPAEAGAFLGTVRIQGSYRDQYDAFIEEGYNGQMAQVDLPLNLRILKKGWTGYGLGLITDKSGDLGFQNTGILATLSYHYPLDRRNTKIISGGLTIGRLQRQLNDPSLALFSDGLIGGGVSSDLALLNQFSEAYTDYSLGIKYTQLISKLTKVELGISVFHAFDFRQNASVSNKTWRRYNLYGIVSHKLNKRFTLQPRVFTSFIRNSYNINLQTLTKYQYSEKVFLGAGLGYRVQDALQVLFSVEYEGWDVGLAYDITVSSASAYNSGRGALELGVRKIFIIPTKPKITKIDICPRL